MLALLRSNGKMSRKKLSEILEVSVREISRYREDLEIAGVIIHEIRGPQGGYELVGKDYLLNLSLSKEEERALQLAEQQIKGQNFIYKKEMSSAVAKIKAVRQTNESVELAFISKGNQVICDYIAERDKWNKINEARICHKKLEISYSNALGESGERIVRPYGIYVYKGANYFVGYCEKREEIRQFKLVRIKEIKITNFSFEVDKEFKLSQYLSHTIGIYKDEMLHVVLKILYPYAQYFKENKWVEEQKITDFQEQGYLICEADIEGKTQIISWILKMGTSCTVLEPKELQEEILEVYRQCINNY